MEHALAIFAVIVWSFGGLKFALEVLTTPNPWWKIVLIVIVSGPLAWAVVGFGTVVTVLRKLLNV